MTDKQPIVFFSRMRPQWCDAVDIALKHNHVFFGYPMQRPNMAYNPQNLHACVISPDADADEWYEGYYALKDSSEKRQCTSNRNLVNEVCPGSIAMIPRPGRGVVYCGKVTSEFKLIDNPPWRDEYFALRKQQFPKEDPYERDDEVWHTADVAQGWQIDKFVPVPLAQVPAWIRHPLYGRQTFGRIKSDASFTQPLRRMSQLMQGMAVEPWGWTLDIREIERRLHEQVTPLGLEHLAVDLLQLEFPAERWIHTGGPGDGGIDGLGADEFGCTVGLLQCKWKHDGHNPFEIDPDVDRHIGHPRRYIATLARARIHDPHATVLGLEEIAARLAKYHRRLPVALSLRIGDGLGHVC